MRIRSITDFNTAVFGTGTPVMITARNAGADLLVMSAFGESKITAMLGLGRATEKVVMSCKVPLLVQA
jgi:nucleotide-binding universal stress UspA family protein